MALNVKCRRTTFQPYNFKAIHEDAIVVDFELEMHQI